MLADGAGAIADAAGPAHGRAVAEGDAAAAKDVEDYELEGSEHIGRYVAKSFGGVVYAGRVAGWLPPTADDAALWHIVYEDGDQEDVEEAELLECAAAHEAGLRRRPPLNRADRHAEAWRAERERQRQRQREQDPLPVGKPRAQEGAKTPVRRRAVATVQEEARPVRRLVSRRGTL